MLEQIIVVDYIDGASGEYFAEFLNQHLSTPNIVWLRKFFNSEELVNTNWDQDFDRYLDHFLTLCQQDNITRIIVPYHLYKWPEHLERFNRISKSVRAVAINSEQYPREIALDFIRKIHLVPVSISDIHKLTYLTKTATLEQKQEISERLRARTLQWIDVTILLSGKNSRLQLINQILTRQLTCPSQDVTIDYGTFYVDYLDIDNKYNLLCKQLDLVPNQQLLEQLIKRNQRNWAELTDYVNQFEEIYKQL